MKTIRIPEKKAETLLHKVSDFCTRKNEHVQVLISKDLYSAFVRVSNNTGVFDVRSYNSNFLEVTTYHYGRDWNGYVANSKKFDSQICIELK